MYPVLISFGPLEIYTYGVFLALAFYFSVQWAVKMGTRRGFNEEMILNLAVVSILSAILGARSTYVYVYWDQFFTNNYWDVFQSLERWFSFLRWTHWWRTWWYIVLVVATNVYFSNARCCGNVRFIRSCHRSGRLLILWLLLWKNNTFGFCLDAIWPSISSISKEFVIRSKF